MPTLDDFLNLRDAPLNTWLGTALVAALLVLFAIAVHWVGARVLRRIARPYPHISLFVRRIDRPVLGVVVVAAIGFVVYQTPEYLHFVSALRDVAAFALVASVTWLSVRCASAVGEAIIAAHPLDTADNLEARRIHTQARVLARSLMVVIVIVGLGAALMTFPNVRQIGASLLASAGVAGLVAGIAARPVLGNLIAGLQIGLSQPIRLDDVVVIQGEWGRVEEITGTYVSVRIWDQRRLIVPLQWFIENPFANWTRDSSQIIGTVFLWLDYRMPLAPLREELARIVEDASEWDRRVQVVQVTDMNERAMQLRVLVSSANSGLNWDLRCRVREGLLTFVNERYPQFLPRARAEVSAELESSAGELPGWTRQARGPAASSTSANTEADPLTGTHQRAAQPEGGAPGAARERDAATARRRTGEA